MSFFHYFLSASDISAASGNAIIAHFPTFSSHFRESLQCMDFHKNALYIFCFKSNLAAILAHFVGPFVPSPASFLHENNRKRRSPHFRGKRRTYCICRHHAYALISSRRNLSLSIAMNSPLVGLSSLVATRQPKALFSVSMRPRLQATSMA